MDIGIFCAVAHPISSVPCRSRNRLEDLQSWVETGAKASTSDPGASAVLPAKRHPAAAQPPAVQTRR
jgi:hypothetical protein